MKIAIHIFTLYLLALSLMPCGDSDGGIVELTNHFFQIEHEHTHNTSTHQHSNDCGDDDCPPFCACSCCSTPFNFIEKPSLEIKIPTPIQGTLASFVPKFIPFQYTNTVWQPPRW